MNTFKFAALAAALLLQPLVYAGSASFDFVSHNPESRSLVSAHHTAAHAEIRLNNSLSLDDVQTGECDPEDDCPRPEKLVAEAMTEGSTVPRM